MAVGDVADKQSGRRCIGAWQGSGAWRVCGRRPQSRIIARRGGLHQAASIGRLREAGA
jgi:hypothetical protein